MSDSQYFYPVNQVQIGSTINRNRFVFIDNNGLTTSPNASTPLGIYTYTNSPTISYGYAQYYNLGQNIPVMLELGQDVNAGSFLTYDSSSCGVLAQYPQAYAQAQQGGIQGDYIRVIMGVFNITSGPFSQGFSLGFKI